jgi:hypothetical protein
MTVGAIANHYQISVRGATKHIQVLELVNLVTKRKVGRYHVVQLEPVGFVALLRYLKPYVELSRKRQEELKIRPLT